jgi:hypothetical protein
MQNTKPATRFFLLLTEYWQLTTEYYPPGCVHRWTSAGKRPKKSHFVSLFGPPGVIPTCRDSISKSFHAKQIGADSWSSRASDTPFGTWDPKASYRFRLIVHYLRAWVVDRGSWTAEEDLCKNHKTPLALAIARSDALSFRTPKTGLWGRSQSNPIGDYVIT